MLKGIGPVPSKIMIISEFPSETDISNDRLFSGYSSTELAKILSEAGIMFSQTYRTTALKITPPGNSVSSLITTKKKEVTDKHVISGNYYVLPVVIDNLAILRQEIASCKPNIIITLGDFALWAVTGEWSITKWRGSLLEAVPISGIDYKLKVIPTFSVSQIYKVWEWRRLMVQDIRKAKGESEFRELIRPNYKFVIRPNYDEVMEILYSLKHKAENGFLKLSLDIEVRQDYIACLGIAWSDTEAISIPFMEGPENKHYWQEYQEFNIIQTIKTLVSKSFIVGQYFTYDSQMIHHYYGFIIDIGMDTQTAHHTIFPNLRKSLDFQSSLYRPKHKYWKEDGKTWKYDIREEDLWYYNCQDAVITYELSDIYERLLPKMNLKEVNDFQQSLHKPVLKTMLRGIKYDFNLRDTYNKNLQDMIEAREQAINFIVGYDINIGSNLQMTNLFYNELKQTTVLGAKTKNPSCDDASLRKIYERSPELGTLISLIQELRSLYVFRNTFISAETEYDGRMHCNYDIDGTVTFRFSSSKNNFDRGLNLQNIPKGEEESDIDPTLYKSGLPFSLPNVRNLFIPDEGNVFFDIDLDSADLRVVVAEANLTEMQAMLNEGKKVYVEVMKEYYKNPNMTKHDKMYTAFKSLCHGTHYLGTPKGLAERIGLLVHEVETVQKWYYGKFPGLKVWQDYIKNQVKTKLSVSNVFGYRTYFFGRIEGTVFNEAVAWIPQSTVGILINKIYRKLYELHPEIEVLLQVHDSLAGQFPIENQEIHKENLLKVANSILLPYKIPVHIPVGVKISLKSWGDCE